MTSPLPRRSALAFVLLAACAVERGADSGQGAPARPDHADADAARGAAGDTNATAEPPDANAAEPAAAEAPGLCGVAEDTAALWIVSPEGVERVDGSGERVRVATFRAPADAQVVPSGLSVRGAFVLAAANFECEGRACGYHEFLIQDSRVLRERERPDTGGMGELAADGYVLRREDEELQWVAPDGTFSAFSGDLEPLALPDARGVLPAGRFQAGVRDYGFFDFRDRSFRPLRARGVGFEDGIAPTVVGAAVTYRAFTETGTPALAFESAERFELVPLGDDARSRLALVSDDRALWYAEEERRLWLFDSAPWHVQALVLPASVDAGAELQVAASGGAFLLYEQAPDATQRLLAQLARDAHELASLEGAPVLHGNPSLLYCAPRLSLHEDGAIAGVEFAGGVAQAVSLAPGARAWRPIGRPLHSVQQVGIERRGDTWVVHAVGTEVLTYCPKSTWSKDIPGAQVLSGSSMQFVRNAASFVERTEVPYAAPELHDGGRCALLLRPKGLEWFDLATLQPQPLYPTSRAMFAPSRSE